MAIRRRYPTHNRSATAVRVQGKDVFSVQQYMESIAVNLILRDPAALMQQYVLPTLQTYNAK